MVDYNVHAAWATGGSHPTTLADGWISYEFAKPSARKAINGDHPFAIKKLYFKTCAAPKKGQKMYARISTPNGKVYDNSYIGNTISWQSSAKVTYGFSAINFHWTDDDGPTLRAWLVSGGPFYFDYTGSGTIKGSGSKTWSGAPVGGYDWVQVALPPDGFAVTRNATDSNRVDFTWDLIKLADTSKTGGSTSLSGYCIEMAKDAAFTSDVRYAYVANGKASAYGLYDGYDWYFRIGTRNEVSEHYSLKCGVWSHTFKLAASHASTPTPASDVGDTGGTEGDTGGPVGSGGDTAGNNGGSTSGTTSSPPGSGGTGGTGDTGGGSTTPTSGQLAAADTALSLELKGIAADALVLANALTVARGAPTVANLKKIAAAAATINADATTIAAKNASYSLTGAQSAWNLVADDADKVGADVEVAVISLAPSDLTVVQNAGARVQTDITAATTEQAKAEDGTEATGDVTGANTSTSQGTITYTPIPPTPAFRTPLGGLLLSRGGGPTPEHSIYLMERGGRRRLAAFGPVNSLKYNRIRDAQSTAEIVLSGINVRKSARAIDFLDIGQGVNRYELAIFRGAERVWEGPVTLVTIGRNTVTIDATDITYWLNRTVMHGAYSNAYPNIDFVVNRIAGIMANELSRKESLNPPVNVLNYVHTYIEAGDAVTTRVTDPGAMTVWQHLDDLAAKSGIDYTVVGRALHIWDTSRPALGRTRMVTQEDFTGDTDITIYGKEQASIQFVTDGQGNFGVAGAIDPFYGEIELVATAYDENGNNVTKDLTNATTVDLAAVSQADLDAQAVRNLSGRNPTPRALSVPANSGFRLDRGIGMDVLVPGVWVPVSATLAGGRTMNQMLKLSEIAVTADSGGEKVAVTLTPTSAADTDPDSALTS